jgi:uncharacterized delta-60 repeat protein
VAVAANDDIFVAGSTFTASDGRDIWIRRYSPGGDGGFVSTQNGGGDSHDEAFGIAIDPGGNLLVAGYVTTASDERDIWVRKYTATGTIEWTDIVSGPDADDDEAHAIASDGIGNVLVTGFVRTGSSGEDIWVRKYDADGGELWTRTVDGPSAGPDNGKGIAADSAGNVIVVGWETTATHGTDVWLRKYDSNGDELWTRTYDAPQHGTDLGESVAVDSSDNVVVAGTIYRGVQSHNVWVRKYDPDGNERWTSVYNSNGFLADGANAVAVDDGDNVLIGGFETRSDLGQARNTWVRRILQ